MSKKKKKKQDGDDEEPKKDNKKDEDRRKEEGTPLDRESADGNEALDDFEGEEPHRATIVELRQYLEYKQMRLEIDAELIKHNAGLMFLTYKGLLEKGFNEYQALKLTQTFGNLSV